MGTASKPTTVTTPSARSPRELEAIVRSLYDSFNQRQLERSAALIAGDGEWTDLPSGTVLRGPDGYLQYCKGWLSAFSDGQIEVLNVVGSGDLVTVEYMGRGTHDGPFQGPDGRTLPPTGKKVALRLMDILQLRGDKIVRGRTYYDTMSLFRQLGAERQEVLRKPGEGTALWMLGGLYEIKVASKESGGALTVMEMTLRPGNGPPPHTHAGEETIYVLEGRLRYQIGAKTYEGGPGSILNIPQGTLETLDPIDDPVRILVTYTPGGIDQFFLEAAKPAERRELPPPSDSPPDVEQLARIGAKYGVVMKLPGGS